MNQPMPKQLTTNCGNGTSTKIDTHVLIHNNYVQLLKGSQHSEGMESFQLFNETLTFLKGVAK